MFYKPKFCCECGEKIERIEWKLLSSRRFCDLCAVEQKQYEVGKRIAGGALMLAALFGVFGYFSGGNAAETPAVTVERASRNLTAASLKGPTAKAADAAPATEKDLPAAGQPEKPRVEHLAPDPSSTVRRPPPAAEYFCGAMTKKGTPCSRRVKTKGRCWQHTGLPEAKKSESLSSEF